MVRIALVAVIDSSQRRHELTGFITSARKAVNITQVELAARLGRPQSYVSKVERGERRLDAIEFCQVAEALGHDPATLLREFLDLRCR